MCRVILFIDKTMGDVIKLIVCQHNMCESRKLMKSGYKGLQNKLLMMVCCAGLTKWWVASSLD